MNHSLARSATCSSAPGSSTGGSARDNNQPFFRFDARQRLTIHFNDGYIFSTNNKESGSFYLIE